jgi:hypothetical protein
MKPISTAVLSFFLLAEYSYAQSPSCQSASGDASSIQLRLLRTDERAPPEAHHPMKVGGLRGANSDKPANSSGAQFATICVEGCSSAAEPETDELPKQRALESCGKKWNDKLQAYKKSYAETKTYRNYYDKWEDSPAERPPKLPLPQLTRASYREFMAECLRDPAATCGNAASGSPPDSTP